MMENAETPNSQPTPNADATWRVVRLDDNGNAFEIARDLTQPAADAMARQFEESGHKQTYWVIENPRDGDRSKPA